MLEQTWTADGKLASVIDANGNTTTYHYDPFNRLDLTTWPGGNTETATYDQADNVVQRTSRAGGTFTLLYDTLYRVTRKTPPSGPVVDYSYDLAGRQTRVSDNSNPIALAFPPGGSTVTYTTTYTYDALNRPTGATWDPAPAATAPAAGPLVSIGHSYDKAPPPRARSATPASASIPRPAASTTTGHDTIRRCSAGSCRPTRSATRRATTSTPTSGTTRSTPPIPPAWRLD